MEQISRGQKQILMSSELGSAHRHMPRVSGHFRLMFSGMDDGQMLIGDGQGFDLSQQGLGIQTNQSVKPDMEIAIFLEFTDSDDHLCIPEARVSWVNGFRFGVSLRTMKLEDRERLCDFIQAHTQQEPVTQG